MSFSTAVRLDDRVLMGEVVLERPAATKILGAVEATLAHLGAMRIAGESASTGRAGIDAKDLANLYGAVRRLRDFLRRSIGVFSNGSPLDLPDEERNLLVQCLLHRISELEAQEAAAERPVDRRLQVERRLALEGLTEQLAIGPVQALPTENSARSSAAEALRRKFATQLKPNPHSEELPESAGPNDLDSFTPQGATSVFADGPSAFGVEATPLDEVEEAVGPLLQPRSLRDARLRAGAELDLIALDRARRRGDWRLAALHLMSLTEGVLVDQALPRARSLGLVGSPETWRLDALANNLFEDLEVHERTLLSLLARCDGFVHPARQLRAPVMVNEQIFEELEGFVRGLFARSLAPCESSGAGR